MRQQFVHELGEFDIPALEADHILRIDLPDRFHGLSFGARSQGPILIDHTKVAVTRGCAS
jgi:hypothetical protein